MCLVTLELFLTLSEFCVFIYESGSIFSLPYCITVAIVLKLLVHAGPYTTHSMYISLLLSSSCLHPSPLHLFLPFFFETGSHRAKSSLEHAEDILECLVLCFHFLSAGLTGLHYASGLHFLSLRNSPGITLTTYKVAKSEFKLRSLVTKLSPCPGSLYLTG